jgi:hypothetical protein
LAGNLHFDTGIGSGDEENYFVRLLDSGNLAGKRAEVETENFDIDYNLGKSYCFDIQLELRKYHYSEGTGFHISFVPDSDMVEHHNKLEDLIVVVVAHAPGMVVIFLGYSLPKVYRMN